MAPLTRTIFDGPSNMAAWEEKLIGTAPDRAIAEQVRRALERLFLKDADLFEFDVNERSITHRLAIYLDEEFRDWNVDCEYNRNGHEPKTLQLNPETIESDDEKGTTVYPDIIVHKRGKPRNHLAIEIKKHNGGSGDKDLKKLRALRNELGYSFALFLRLRTEAANPDVVELRWVVD
ncbi:MAG: hypothetical protein ACREMQ_05590 [Longimicrobiales bacterium]